MARIKLLEDDELPDATRAAAQRMEAQGIDTCTLRADWRIAQNCSMPTMPLTPARKGYSVSEELIELVRLRIARHNDCFT